MPQDKADNTDFELRLVGRGWEGRAGERGEPGRTVTTTVRGKNIGEGGTAHRF